MSATAAWIWVGTGAVAAAAGLVLALWALFWDRSRGRKRCPKCWYSWEKVSVSTAGRVCPECRWVVGDPRQLQKTRRRWVWAGAGVVAVILGAGAVLTPKVQRDGAWSLVPTPALIAVADLRGLIKEPGSLATETTHWSKRAAGIEAWSRLDELMKGSVTAAPWYVPWAIDRYLAQVPEDRVLWINPVWPSDGRVFARIAAPSILQLSREIDIRWRHSGSSQWHSISNGGGGVLVSLGEAPGLARATHEVEIEFREHEKLWWRGTRQFVIEMAGRTRDVVDVVITDDVSCGLLERFDVDLKSNGIAGITFGGWSTLENEWGLDVGFEANVRCGNELVARAYEYFAMGMPQPSQTSHWIRDYVSLDWSRDQRDQSDLIAGGCQTLGNSLRVRGLPELAASEVLSFGWHGTGRPRAWGGEFTVVFANQQ